MFDVVYLINGLRHANKLGLLSFGLILNKNKVFDFVTRWSWVNKRNNLVKLVSSYLGTVVFGWL